MNALHDVVLTGAGAIAPRGDFTLHGGWTERDFAPRRQDFALSNYLSTPKTYLDRASALALGGCALALRDAGHADLKGGPDWGIALSTRAGCLDTMRAFWDVLAEKGARLAPPLLFSHSMLNTPASLCAIEWGLQGPHVTVCAGQRSGLEAVRAAFDALRLGRARAMLCGGVEALTASHELLEGETEQRAEAACFFVLERADATNADARPVADEWFERAASVLDATRGREGDCGGATGALALLDGLAA